MRKAFSRGLLAAGVFAAFAGYLFWVARFTVGGATGADETGYLGLARGLAQGTLAEPLPLPPGVAPGEFSPWLFTPLGFAPRSAGDFPTMGSVYPPGLPFLQRWAYAATGDWERAARLVSLLHLGAALLLLGLLGRVLGLGAAESLASTALFAVNPLVLRSFAANMSDGPATTWLLAALVLAAWAGRRGGRWQGLGAFGAGVVLGLSLAIRPTNLLGLPALVLLLGGRWKLLLAALAGLLAGATPLALYNGAAFGSPLRFGYGSLAERFHVRYMPARLGFSLRWLFVFLGAFGPALMVLPWPRDRVRRRLLLLAAASFLPFLLFYSLYWFTDRAWWFLRFLLPGLGPLFLAVGAGALALGDSVPRAWLRRLARGSLLLALFASAAFWDRKLAVFSLARQHREVQQAVRSLLPAPSSGAMVVFCGELSGPVWFYTGFPLVRVDRASPQELARLLHRLRQQQVHAVGLVSRGELGYLSRLFPGLLYPLQQGSFVKAAVDLAWQPPPPNRLPPSAKPSVVPVR